MNLRIRTRHNVYLLQWGIELVYERARPAAVHPQSYAPVAFPNSESRSLLLRCQVVFMHPDGPDAAGCAQCVASWSGKINTYDRPDVVPGQTAQSSGSDIFAVKVHYTVPSWLDTVRRENRDHVLYIYFQTAGYPGRRKGPSVQYCTRSFGGYSDAGAALMCYGLDAHGDTFTGSDSGIDPGSTYVVMPPFQAIQALGYRFPNLVLPRIRVDAVSQFDDCNDMICPIGKDISATVAIDFVSESEAASAVSGAVQLTVTPSAPVTAAQDLSFDNGRIDISYDDFKNDKGVADITLTVCPTGGLESITLFIYDLPPLSSLLPGHTSSPSGYNAMQKHFVLADDCCNPGDSLPVVGMKAVVVRAMGSTNNLNIAEIRIFVGGADVSSTAHCYSFPTEGYWWNGADRSTGSQPNLNDGDLTTYSHQGDTVATGNYDMCLLPSKVGQIEKVEVVPRNDGYKYRAADTNVEIYTTVTVDSATKQWRPVGLLHEGEEIVRAVVRSPL